LDSFPVTEGHARVIPKRHVVNAFDLLSVAAENIAKAKVTV
jgi:diadenosine tetraphosphate (Ap4A) HIT family hydrolase